MSGLLTPVPGLAPILVDLDVIAADQNYQPVDGPLHVAEKSWAIAPYCTDGCRSYVDRGDGKYVAAGCYRPAREVYYFKGNDKMPTEFGGRAFGPAHQQPTEFRVTVTADTTDGPRTLTSDPIPTQGEAADSLAGVIAGVGEEYVIETSIDGHTRESTHLGPDYCRECSREASDWITWPCSPEKLAESKAAAEALYASAEGDDAVAEVHDTPSGEPFNPEAPQGYDGQGGGYVLPPVPTVPPVAAGYPDALAAHEADAAAERRAWESELCDSMEIPRGSCAHCLRHVSAEVDAVVYGTPFEEPTPAAARELGATFAARRAATQASEVASFVQRAIAHETAVESPALAAPVGASVDGPAPAVTSETKASMKFSNSEIRTFKRCRRKWWLSYFRGFTPRREGVGPLSLGNMVHKPLELYYAQPARDPETFDWATPLAEYVEERLANPDLPDHLHGQMLEDYELVKIMLRGYFEWLVEEGNDSEINVIAAEREIEAYLGDVNGVNVWIMGKLDGEVETKSDNQLGFIDHKSAANLTDLPKMGQKDEQFQWYGLLQRLEAAELGRTDVRFANGGVWNILRKVKRTASARPPFYGRVTVRHNEEVYRSFFARVWGEVADILRVRSDLDAGAPHVATVYPNPTRDCSWDCPFVSICPQFDDGSDVESILATEYVVHDPYARYTEIEKGHTV